MKQSPAPTPASTRGRTVKERDVPRTALFGEEPALFGHVAEVGGEVVARPVMTLSVSFDHRVVDGARGAEFLDTLASLIEEPAGMVA